MEFEASDEVALFHGEQEITKDTIASVDEVFERIEAVTADDIQKVANAIFKPESLNLAVVGPHKYPEKILQLLKF